MEGLVAFMIAGMVGVLVFLYESFMSMLGLFPNKRPPKQLCVLLIICLLFVIVPMILINIGVYR